MDAKTAINLKNSLYCSMCTNASPSTPIQVADIIKKTDFLMILKQTVKTEKVDDEHYQYGLQS